MKRQRWAIKAEWTGSDEKPYFHTEYISGSAKIAAEMVEATRTWHARHNHTQIVVKAEVEVTGIPSEEKKNQLMADGSWLFDGGIQP